MAIELAKEKWSGVINQVKIGAAKAISVGQEQALPFLHEEGGAPHKPVVAYEVWDTVPADWPEALISAYGNVLKDPVAWVKKCVTEFGAQLVAIKLISAHPDMGNKSVEEIAALVEKIKKAAGVPLIISGCGDNAKDNLILPACAEALKGENCLIGSVTQDNYKTITAACLADGHSIIAESPIDINIAKQLNILISDMGMPAERIVINPTVGALGYGLEYAYSIMERARLAALSGDKMLSMPFICFVGQETWRTKEARATEEELAGWGPALERGIVWEALTSAAFLQAGADILVMRHPKAIDIVKKNIEELMRG
ncbi:MAG: acetyl-CoA decarbonylase/synthase complex subunit delta [Candidatus Omnitrophica bacterium]|nr:acetyl-CoA decarbonylase/synthase complex subunit delta [Candidatus Omnitrophota bacterium]MDD5610400.1 acetyl-CoA decarbonylase/synthase complex subunit delta [Candidatus Omnitrophota bacterium]